MLLLWDFAVVKQVSSSHGCAHKTGKVGGIL